MQCCERAAQLDRNLRRLAGAERALLRDDLPERPAGDLVEGEVQLAADLFDAVDANDVGMIDAGDQARLSQTASATLGGERALGPQHLDRDLAVEGSVGRGEHASMSALA